MADKTRTSIAIDKDVYDEAQSLCQQPNQAEHDRPYESFSALVEDVLRVYLGSRDDTDIQSSRDRLKEASRLAEELSDVLADLSIAPPE